MSRFQVDALTAIRLPGLPSVTGQSGGVFLQVDQAAGYWHVGNASPQQSAVDIQTESLSGGTVTFSVLVNSSPTLAGGVIVAATGPISNPGRVTLGVAREAIDNALVALGAAVAVSSGGVSTPTPCYMTIVAQPTNGASVAWNAQQSQFAG